MEKLLKEIESARKALKGNRKGFWNKNKKEFEKNILKLIKMYHVPNGWKIYVVVSSFVGQEKTRPYDLDSWSAANLIGATKRQGFEIMLFFNRARAEFASLGALAPLVEHEMVHVTQAAKDPWRYLKSILDDNLSRELENEADKKAGKLNNEFRKEWVLESIVYCYDMWGWKEAKKMVDYLFKDIMKRYGGGYEQEMNEGEHAVFLKALNAKDIDIFIDYFN